MTLDEAIRVHTVLKGAPVLKNDPIIIEALQLGIEAMKFCQKFKEMRRLSFQPILPGETKE